MEQQSKEPALVFLPKENTNDDRAKLLTWRVPSGTSVQAGQSLAVFETSKTTFELYAPVPGVLKYRHHEGDEIPVGSFVCLIGENESSRFPDEQPVDAHGSPCSLAPAPVAAAPKRIPPLTSSEPALAVVRFSAAAQALLEGAGIDVQLFAHRGLVRSQDVHAVLAPQPQPLNPGAPDASDVIKPHAVVPATGVAFRTVELSRSKQLEISFLRSGAQHTLPCAVTLVCPTNGMRGLARRAGANVSAVLLFEVGRLLKKYPNFNAFFSEQMARFYEEVNIGFAIDAGLGLKVAVLRQADTKSLLDLDKEIQDVLVHYLNSELPKERLAGGTFTITDLAQEGATFFTPLINQGQSAILGVGAEQFAPHSTNGWFHLTLAFDHQLSNGREATQFLVDLRSRLASHEANWSAAVKEEPYCTRCERTLSMLREIRAYLVEEVRPDGCRGGICSLCLKGL